MSVTMCQEKQRLRVICLNVMSCGRLSGQAVPHGRAMGCYRRKFFRCVFSPAMTFPSFLRRASPWAPDMDDTRASRAAQSSQPGVYTLYMNTHAFITKCSAGLRAMHSLPRDSADPVIHAVIRHSAVARRRPRRSSSTFLPVRLIA